MTIKESELALFQFQQRRRANIGRVLPTKGGGGGGGGGGMKKKSN